MPSSQRRLLLLILPLAAILAAGCSGDVPAPSQTPAPTLAAPTQTPPTPQPTATAEPEDLGPGSIELVHRAWASIIDYHIGVPEARPLLQSAVRDVAANARARTIASPPAPSLSGGREEMWQQFADWYLALLGLSPQDAWQDYRWTALTAMTRSLNDCHTFFLRPARTEQLTDIRTGRASGGVGLELAPVRPSYVREIVTGGPAQRAGVLAGDIVVAIDGQDVTGLGVEVIAELLRGDPGSSLSLEVRRPSTGAVLTLPLTRALVRAPVVEGRVRDDGFGYIRIRSFTMGSTLAEAVDKIVADFEAAGVAGWLLDLRDNPGGDSNLGLGGRFVGEVVVERTILRDGGLELQYGAGEQYPDRPLAVLVNGGTASVAEIFASMLQDYGRGRVFGAPTQRCAGFVALESYPDGSTLGVTIAHSLSPLSERPLWQTGVVPNTSVIRTQEDVANGRDPVLDAAVAWLRTQAP